jgi:putative toxin-antitoxin system antitoxin component (TIGR02293 family)
MIIDNEYKKVLVFATEVLGNKTKARKWLAASQYELGGMVPLDLIKTPEGLQKVCRLLGRIDDGVLL